MRIATVLNSRIPFLIAVLFAASMLRANPIAPMPITKVNYLDSLHWTIEFDAKQLGINWKKSPQTDSITLGCAADPSGTIPMQPCARPVRIDTISGSGVITSQHFPSLKLTGGLTIYIGVKNDNYPDRGPKLPPTIQPNTTIELISRSSTCTDYPVPGVPYTYPCTIREYITTVCPPYTPSTGRINGILTNTSLMPLPGIHVLCYNKLTMPPIASTQTMSNGSFIINNLDPCPPHLLEFDFPTYRTDYMVQPQGYDRNSLDISIQIDYPPTGTKKKLTVPAKKEPAVRLLTSSAGNRKTVVLTVSDDSLQGEGVCELYSLSGEIIRSLPFACLGVGTYTIALDGSDGNGRPIPAAACLCRITIGTELVCKSVITR